MAAPDNLKYTSDHEWLRIDGNEATVGITEFAANQLGDIVFVELPEEGETVSSGTVVGELESTKSVGEIFAPTNGTIARVNDAVSDDPSLVNSDPYGEGWLFAITFDELGQLLDADAYNAQNS